MTTVRSNDRRKSVRLKGRKQSILIHPNGIRQIQDISLGGLSFHCPQDEFLPVQWPIEIIFAGTLLYMSEVPVRLVRERKDEAAGLTALPSKEIGVEFIDINEENRILLNRMLTFLQEDSTH